MSGLPLPDDARVTLTVAQLRAIVEGRGRTSFDGVSTGVASRLTGESSRTLRRLWNTWDRVQHDGGTPEVRVSRKSGADRSDLLFDRGDCSAYGARHGKGQPAESVIRPSRTFTPPAGPDGPPDESEAIADKLFASRDQSHAS